MKDKVLNHIREVCGLKIPYALPLPVKYDGYNYFWGAENEIVGDVVDDYTQGEYKADDIGEPFRIRGWGRIQYIQHPDKTPEQLQNEVAVWIAEAINAYSVPKLEHVLMAMKLTGHHWESLSVKGDIMKFAIPSTEVTHFTDPDNGTPGENYNWHEFEYNLSLPADQQSDEFYEALADILGIK